MSGYFGLYQVRSGYVRLLLVRMGQLRLFQCGQVISC
jgi:hypothetical protein